METRGKSEPCQSETLVAKRGQVLPRPAIDWDYGMTWLSHFLRLALAGIFIYAGVAKLLGPKAFTLPP